MKLQQIEHYLGTFERSPTKNLLGALSREYQERHVLREMRKQGFCMQRDAKGRFYSALSQSTYTDRLARIRGEGLCKE